MEKGSTTSGQATFYMLQKKIKKNTYKVEWQLGTKNKTLTDTDCLFLTTMYQLLYGKEVYCR